MLRPSSVRAFTRTAPPRRWSPGTRTRGFIISPRRTHHPAAAAKAEATICPWVLNRASVHVSQFSTLPVPPPTSLEVEEGSGVGRDIRSSGPGVEGVGVNYRCQQQQLGRRRCPLYVTDGAQPWTRDVITNDVNRAAKPDNSGIRRNNDGYNSSIERNTDGSSSNIRRNTDGSNSGIRRNTNGNNSGIRRNNDGYNSSIERNTDGSSSGIRRNTSDISTRCGITTTTTSSTSLEHERTTGASGYVSQDIIRRLATARRRKNWRTALAHLEEIEQKAEEVGGKAGRQQQWDVWCVSGASRNGDVERARTTVYNMVLDILGGRKRWQEAFVLLETMRGRRVVVDIYTLNSLLKACSAAGRVELVLALLKEMKIKRGPTTAEGGRGLQQPLPAPDTISYNITLSALARAGETSLALSLFDEMVLGNDSRGGGGAAELNKEVDRESVWPAPRANLASYNTALSACARCAGGGLAMSGEEGLERAFEIFEAMQRGDRGAPSPDLVTYKEMIAACGRAGHWDQALSWLDAAIEQGFTPNAGLFYEAIAACRRGGVWRRALSVLEHMQEGFGVSPDKFCSNMALRACADAGQIKKALQILDEKLYGSMGASGFSYSPILDALAREGDPELALRLLREIRSSTPKAPNGWHYGSVFLAFLNAGHEPGALEIRSEWRTMQSAEATARMKSSTTKTSENLPAATTGEKIVRKQRKMADRNVFEGENGGNSDRILSSSSCDTEDIFPSEGGDEEFTRSSAAGAAFCNPGDRFSPSDLVGLAVGHADAGRWSDCLDALEMAREACRAARSGVLSRANEILLGGGEGGLGLAGWREVAARNSDATERVEEACRALRGCYEAAIESLGRAERVEQSFELLKEAATFADEHGFRIDPACFVPALQACGGVKPRVVFDQTLNISSSVSHSVIPEWGKWDTKSPNPRPPEDSGCSELDLVESTESANAEAGHRYRSVDGKSDNSKDSDESGWNSVARANSTGADRDGVEAGYLVESQGKGREFSDAGGGSTSGSGSPPVDERKAKGSKEVSMPCEAAAGLLGRMEAEAGVVPDCWCVNVVMEAAILDKQWSLASELFDEAYRRQEYGVGYRATASEIAAEAKAPWSHGVDGVDGVGSEGGIFVPFRDERRGLRDMRAGAVDRMAPNAVTYHLALQACASALADYLSSSDHETRSEQHIIRPTNDCDIREEKELQFASRALSLTRKMGKAGVRLRPETAALAQQICARAGRMGAAIEIRQALEEQEAERRDKGMLAGDERWRLREKPQRTLARY